MQNGPLLKPHERSSRHTVGGDDLAPPFRERGPVGPIGRTGPIRRRRGRVTFHSGFCAAASFPGAIPGGSSRSLAIRPPCEVVLPWIGLGRSMAARVGPAAGNSRRPTGQQPQNHRKTPKMLPNATKNGPVLVASVFGVWPQLQRKTAKQVEGRGRKKRKKLPNATKPGLFGLFRASGHWRGRRVWAAPLEPRAGLTAVFSCRRAEKEKTTLLQTGS